MSSAQSILRTGSGRLGSPAEWLRQTTEYVVLSEPCAGVVADVLIKLDEFVIYKGLITITRVL